jgi:hypothetical protein
MPEPAPPPEVRTGAWFDGVLIGAVEELGELERAVADLNSAGATRARLEVDGGRFSLLLDDRRLPVDAGREPAIRALVERLDAVAAAASRRGELESTLRSVTVEREEVVERLFAARGRALEVVGRSRPRQPSDEQRFPAPAGPAPRDGRRLLFTALGLLLVFGALAWQRGYVDRLFSPRASSLEVDCGLFAPRLAADVDSRLGDYVVTVRRGDGYPATAQAVEEQVGAATTPLERAAARVVADGGRVYVRLEDRDGRVLEVAPVELRALLGAADGRVTCELGGRMDARRVRIDLDSGSRP